MLMLSDADKEACASDAAGGRGGGLGVDKLLFSQGRAPRTRSCSATLMQSSETVFAFGVSSPSKPTLGSQQTASPIVQACWLPTVTLQNADVQ